MRFPTFFREVAFALDLVGPLLKMKVTNVFICNTEPEIPMKSTTFRASLMFPLAALASLAAIVAACGDDDTQVSPTPDSGTNPPTEAGGGTDSGPGTDSSTPTDSGTDSGPTEVKPISLALSPAGHDRFFGITYDTAGNLYAVGQITASTDAADEQETVVAKITAAGALDTTFGTGGFVKTNLVVGPEQPRNIIVQSTGKIVIAATIFHAGTVAADRDVAVARFNANGTIDNTFGPDGNGKAVFNLSDPDTTTSYDSQWGLALGPSDSIFVEGGQKSPTANDTDFFVLKLGANGTPDATFNGGNAVTVDVGPGYNASPRNITVLPTGVAIATGYFRNGTDTATDPVQPVLIKILADGTLDSTFGTNGVYTETIFALAFEVYGAVPQGTSFVTAGYGRNASSESEDWLSLRIKADGTRDMTWGTGGFARVDYGGQTDNARNIIALPDGRFVIIGAGRKTSSNQDAMLGMLTSTGQWDTTFGPKGLRAFDIGATDHFWGVSLSPNNKTLAVGGISGTKTDGGHDDSLVYLLPL